MDVVSHPLLGACPTSILLLQYKKEERNTLVLATQAVVLALLQVCAVEDTRALFKSASTCDCNEKNMRGHCFLFAGRLL